MLSEFGMAVVERCWGGSVATMSGMIARFIHEKELLHKHQDAIFIIAQPIPCSVSSTALRALISRNKSIRYLTPDSIIAYIHKHSLYQSQP
jgi:nicotinic acid mononucleotide adenylyltransferase